MRVKQILMWTVVFFVSLQSVCSGQADGVDTVPTDEVSVSGYDTVSLNVQNTDLGQVLQLLSIQGRRNIVPSPSVAGTVTANLYDVTFEEALDAILQQNGAGYLEKGNFIYVYTMDELASIEEANRQMAYEVIRLNYITAADASTFVTPLLSQAGSIAISGEAAPGFQPTMADAGANSRADADTMVVRDYVEHVEEIRKVIAVLDVRPKQVLVEATILKADISEDMAFGVDFSILGNIAIDSFTSPLGAVGELISGAVTAEQPVGGINTTVGNTTTGDSGVTAGIVTNNVAAFVRALDKVTDTTVVANPKVLVLNRQRADVLVGEKIGYLSTTATSTATTQTVEFLDTGTQLTVRPFVSDDGYIRLELKPQVSTARIREAIPGGTTAAVTIPDEITQELTTNIMVRDGETVVLGGLFKEDTVISRNQVPGLGDIPIAGAAFQGRDDNLTRFEIVFLITPHVVKENAMYEAGKSAIDSGEMFRIGAREGLLPWTRSKMSAGHLREALTALENNDADTAMREVDMALALDADQVEALRLKEKLNAQRTYWPDRSMLEEAVDIMVEEATGVEQKPRVREMKPDPRPATPLTDNEPLTSGIGFGQTFVDTFPDQIEPVATQPEPTYEAVEPEVIAENPAEITVAPVAEEATFEAQPELEEVVTVPVEDEAPVAEVTEAPVPEGPTSTFDPEPQTAGLHSDNPFIEENAWPDSPQVEQIEQQLADQITEAIQQQISNDDIAELQQKNDEAIVEGGTLTEVIAVEAPVVETEATAEIVVEPVEAEQAVVEANEAPPTDGGFFSRTFQAILETEAVQVEQTAAKEDDEAEVTTEDTTDVAAEDTADDTTDETTDVAAEDTAEETTEVAADEDSDNETSTDVPEDATTSVDTDSVDDSSK